MDSRILAEPLQWHERMIHIRQRVNFLSIPLIMIFLILLAQAEWDGAMQYFERLRKEWK